jgi:CheY-like chemotaxis protein
VPHTLLLADDSVTIQRVIELTFADEDVQVVAVSNGDQAIQRLDTAPPDIVLADIGMPGKSGYEVAQYIKKSPHLAHIPVVLLTGAFEPVDQARAAAVGCDGVLAKPFEPQLVIGRVKELLAKPGRVTPALDADLAPPPSAAGDFGVPPLADQSVATAAPTPPPAEIGDYFDRLDAAFASLTSGGTPPAGKPAEPPASAPPPSAPDDLDWLGAPIDTLTAVPDQWDFPEPPSDAADLPLSFASAVPSLETAAAAQRHAPETAPDERQTPPGIAAPPEVEREPQPERKPAELPALADAFAALLAAEQNAPEPALPPSWPASGPSTEALAEEVARRVLDRLSDRVVRETAADLVATIAERLIREEIERIKASIK